MKVTTILVDKNSLCERAPILILDKFIALAVRVGIREDLATFWSWAHGRSNKNKIAKPKLNGTK